MLMIFWFILKAENSYLNLVQYKKKHYIYIFYKNVNDFFLFILKAKKSYSNLYKYQKRRRASQLAYLIVENKVAPSLAIVCGNVGDIATSWLLFNMLPHLIILMR